MPIDERALSLMAISLESEVQLLNDMIYAGDHNEDEMLETMHQMTAVEDKAKEIYEFIKDSIKAIDTPF